MDTNLPLVVDNPRFLILPWIKIPNLGSHILALIRRIACPRTGPSATTPRPCSSIVETPRYTGAVYKASGSCRRQGRGRYDSGYDV